MTTELLDLPRTTARSGQLIAASERITLDPFTEIDWEQPLDDTAYYLPPELLALYGSPIWDEMDEHQRIRYSRHELAATCGAAIWFENALMQIVLKHLVHVPVTDPMHRYLLIEVADECRHSAMFGEFIRRAGTPAYAPDRPIMVDSSTGGRALSYLLILAIEELLDHVNRATMRDERVHVVSRQMAKLHVTEESRHVSFAKTFLSEIWPQLDETDQATVVTAAPILVGEIVSLSLDPAVFTHLGITDGDQIARSNPHHQAFVIAGLAKLTSFLESVGIIPDPTPWRELGLIA